MVEKLIKRFRIKVIAIDEVEDSHSSTVYKCKLADGECVYLKIPFTKIKFERELEAYNILRDRVSIPQLIDYWSGDENCPGAFLLSALKGCPLTTNVLPDVAYQVGVLQAKLHTVKPPKDLKSILNVFPNWSEFMEEKFYSFAEEVIDVLEPSLYKKAIQKFEEMKKQLPHPDGPSFIHLDFRPANIIVDGNQIAGVIDFESVRFGSTEMDFSKLYRDFLSFDSNFYEAFQEGYNSVRPLINLDIVLPFYRFTDAFNSIGWCIRRGKEKHALFLEENMTLLKHFLRS